MIASFGYLRLGNPPPCSQKLKTSVSEIDSGVTPVDGASNRLWPENSPLDVPTSLGSGGAIPPSEVPDEIRDVVQTISTPGMSSSWKDHMFEQCRLLNHNYLVEQMALLESITRSG